MDKKFLRLGWQQGRLAAQRVLGKHDDDQPLAVSHRYRAWINEMGAHDHLPNFQFPIFAEYGRYELITRHRKANPFKFVGMIANQQFIYIRPIRWFEKFTVDTQLIFWDEKYSYFLHDFKVGEQKVVVALVKIAFKKNGHVTNPVTLFGEAPQPIDEHRALLDSWLAAQENFKALG